MNVGWRTDVKLHWRSKGRRWSAACGADVRKITCMSTTRQGSNCRRCKRSK